MPLLIHQQTDDAKLMHGSPTALQFVGPRLGDAAMLAYVEELDAVLHA